MDKYVELTQKVQNTKLNLSTPPLLVLEYSFATLSAEQFDETERKSAEETRN
jgi:hypothetical protein